MTTHGDTTTHVLLVEDNPGDAELLRMLLDEAEDASGDAEDDAVPLRASVRWVTRLRDARAALAEAPAHVVLLDLSLPDARGIDTVAQMRAAAPTLPIVVLTGLDDEALAVRAMRAGAQDYLVKGTVTGAGLRRALRHAVERHLLVDAARRATAARDVVLGVVAHDLRNPLATIKMCAAALGTAPHAAQAAELSGVVRHAAEWMERIIRDLLDVTAIEAGRLAVDRAPLDPADVVERTHEQFAPIAAERGITLVADVASALPTILADGERLQQALGNLLGNALKFTPAGGTVTLRGARANGGVRLAVHDTGPGIPPDHLPHLFDRFWQARETRRAGAGLGLAIAQGIVQAHGGRIEVASVPGAGAEFAFEVVGSGEAGSIPAGSIPAGSETAESDTAGTGTAESMTGAIVARHSRREPLG
ncbi:MAG: ATP-binding protein [Gemmatirosa sp.]